MKIAHRRTFGLLLGLEAVIRVAYWMLFGIILLIGGYALYDVWQVEFEAIQAEQVADNYLNEVDDEVDFALLQQKNPEIVAWLKIPDTNINFPVMQAKDNRFYLSHDFERNYATVGGVFLDYRNSKDFSDGFSIVYGHRMSNGRMFSDVGKFKDQDFFDSHREAILYTPSKKLIIKFYVYASVYGGEKEIYNVGAVLPVVSRDKVFESAQIVADGYKVLNSADLGSVNLNSANLNSAARRKGNQGDIEVSQDVRTTFHDIRETFRGNEKWLLLSTCSTERLENRDVLLGVLEEEGSSDNDG